MCARGACVEKLMNRSKTKGAAPAPGASAQVPRCFPHLP